MTSDRRNSKLQTSSLREASSSKPKTSPLDRFALHNACSGQQAVHWDLILGISLKFEVWGLKLRSPGYLRLLALLVIISFGCNGSEPRAFGPLLHDFPLTVAPGQRTQA